MDTHSWHKQMAAKIARNCERDQFKLLDKIFIDGAKDIAFEMLINLERKFFLSRKAALATIDAWKRHNGYTRIQH